MSGDTQGVGNGAFARQGWTASGEPICTIERGSIDRSELGRIRRFVSEFVCYVSYVEIYILYLFNSENVTIFLLSEAYLLSGFQPGEMNVSDEQPGS